MGRPPVIPAEKTRIVLSVLAGELSVAEAARKEKVSEQSRGRWKAEFLEAGRTALASGRTGPSTREAQRERPGAVRHGPSYRPHQTVLVAGAGVDVDASASEGAGSSCGAAGTGAPGGPGRGGTVQVRGPPRGPCYVGWRSLSAVVPL